LGRIFPDAFDKALAVHPDYLLRQEILRAIRDRWLSLSPTGWNSVVAGLIRDGQMEMALDRLDYMGRVGIPVQQWLHSLTIYSLCELREFDMVLILIRNRASQHYDISKDMWMHLLDEASKARHYEMACDAWKQVVDLEGLNVSSVVCAQVLTLAAKKGDPQMAESVIRFLIKAEVTPNGEDYEKLVEAYVMADDLKSAFNVLGTMHKDQIPVSERSTRSILHYMIEKRVNPANIWNRLKALKQDKVDVPVACANVVIEYCEHAYNRASHAVPQALNMALQFYKEVFELCPVGADVNTFNIMFSFCRHARRPDVCMFFVREMAALGIPPNQTTLERLILMSLEMKNFRAGFMYFLDLMERGRKLTHTTAAEIRYFCLDSQDEYACRFMSHEMVKAPVKAKTGQRFSMRYHVVSDRDSSDGKRASDESDRDGNNLESWQNPKAADDGDKNTTNVS
jgi:pentatricopeptide repeat protein